MNSEKQAKVDLARSKLKSYQKKIRVKTENSIITDDFATVIPSLNNKRNSEIHAKELAMDFLIEEKSQILHDNNELKSQMEAERRKHYQESEFYKNKVKELENALAKASSLEVTGVDDVEKNQLIEKIALLNKRILKMEEDKVTEKSVPSSSIMELNNKTDILERQVSDQADRLQQSFQLLSEAQEMIKSEEAKNEMIAAANMKKEKANLELKEKLAKSLKSIEEYQGEINSLTSTIKILTVESTAIINEKQDLETRFSELAKEKEGLLQSNGKLANEITDLKKNSEERGHLLSLNSLLQKDNMDLLQTLESLRKEHTAVITELENQKSAMKNNVDQEQILEKIQSLREILDTFTKKKTAQIPTLDLLVTIEQDLREIVSLVYDKTALLMESKLLCTSIEKKHAISIKDVQRLESQLEKYRHFDMEQNERYIAELNAKMMEMDRTIKKLVNDKEIVVSELKLVNSLWHKEKLRGSAHVSPTPKETSETENPTNIENLPIVHEAYIQHDTILSEMEKLRSFRHDQEDRIEILMSDNARISRLLQEEKRLTELLSAECDALPDYIEMYHQERKALQHQMSILVSQLRVKNELSSVTPQGNSTTIWETDRLDDTKLQSEFERNYSTAVGNFSKGMVSGIVLRMPKDLSRCCKQCYFDDPIVL